MGIRAVVRRWAVAQGWSKLWQGAKNPVVQPHADPPSDEFEHLFSGLAAKRQKLRNGHSHRGTGLLTRGSTSARQPSRWILLRGAPPVAQLPGIVPAYSGGPVPEFHRLPSGRLVHYPDAIRILEQYGGSGSTARTVPKEKCQAMHIAHPGIDSGKISIQLGDNWLHRPCGV
jgi:hypothetical protein